jgi:hypothetical protein
VAVGTRTPLAQNGHVGTSVRYFDSVVNVDRDKQLTSYQTYTFNFFGPKPADVKKEVALKAALFADGSNFGDSEWVARLIAGRNAFLHDIEDAVKILQSARTSGESREQLIQAAENARGDALPAVEEITWE